MKYIYILYIFISLIMQNMEVKLVVGQTPHLASHLAEYHSEFQIQQHLDRVKSEIQRKFCKNGPFYHSDKKKNFKCKRQTMLTPMFLNSHLTWILPLLVLSYKGQPATKHQGYSHKISSSSNYSILFTIYY